MHILGELAAGVITALAIVFMLAVFVLVVRNAFGVGRKYAHGPGCNCGGTSVTAIIGPDGKDTGRSFRRPVCLTRPQA